jgi:hypothetical protein
MHRKKESCIELSEISFINNPPELHKIAVTKTARKPLLCSDRLFIVNLLNNFMQDVQKLPRF